MIELRNNFFVLTGTFEQRVAPRHLGWSDEVICTKRAQPPPTARLNPIAINESKSRLNKLFVVSTP